MRGRSLCLALLLRALPPARCCHPHGTRPSRRTISAAVPELCFRARRRYALVPDQQHAGCRSPDQACGRRGCPIAWSRRFARARSLASSVCRLHRSHGTATRCGSFAARSKDSLASIRGRTGGSVPASCSVGSALGHGPRCRANTWRSNLPRTCPSPFSGQVPFSEMSISSA
jgi:hypothetical protein